MRDINQQFKVLGSEMKLVESQFDKQDRSVSALTSRNEVLNRQIAEQKDKVELLWRALENRRRTHLARTINEPQQWAVQLNNAQAQLNNMERELKSNEKAIDGVGDEFQDAEKKADGFGDEVKEAANKADDARERFSQTRRYVEDDRARTCYRACGDRYGGDCGGNRAGQYDGGRCSICG